MGDPALKRASSCFHAANGDRSTCRTRASLALFLCATLVLSGCTAVGLARRALREPGAKLMNLPDEVAAQYDCATRRLPYFVFERQEVNPDRMHAGDEFNHRFVYALCPRKPTEVLVGTLRTRIKYKDRTIAQDKEADFELQPGRWAVDSFVRLPDDAAVGIYSLDVEFTSSKVKFRHEATFGVDAR